MKHCPKCDKTLDLENFYFRKRGPRSGKYYEKCKNCMKIRGRAYKEKRQFIVDAKDKPCADCGKKYPFYVMDFDHQEPKNKTKEVSYMFTRNWSLDKIKVEAEKCEVVCANCHRIRTYLKRYAKVAKVVKARV